MKFLTKKDLINRLPWGESTIRLLIKKGTFKAIKTGIGKNGGSKQIFLESQIEEAVHKMMEAS